MPSLIFFVFCFKSLHNRTLKTLSERPHTHRLNHSRSLSLSLPRARAHARP